MKKLLVVLLLCFESMASAQKNYVLNGDFEQYSSCPLSNDDINVAKYWVGIDSQRVGIATCIPDYCNTCADTPNRVTTVPKSDAYYQWPHSGNGMAQIVMFVNYWPYGRLRDYLQGRLVKRLTPGKSYCVTFYVCLSESSRWAVKEISAYFDNGSIDTASECWRPQTRYTPQITNQGGIISDTMHWTKIEGSFVANGTEQFITIGNFKDNASTTKSSIPANPYSANYVLDTASGYLTDDVSVVETSTKADAGPDTHVGYGDSVYIGLPPSEAIWNSWTVLGSPAMIGQGPGIWVRPATTTTYVVTQNLCGNITTDTVKVEVWAAGLTSIHGQTQAYFLSPNPSRDGLVELRQSIADNGPVQIVICDAIGKTVYLSVQMLKDSRLALDLSGLAAGVYYVRLKDDRDAAYHLKLVRQ
jgi:hypothetical protein